MPTAAKWYFPSLTDVDLLPDTDVMKEIKETISDHLPKVSRFDFTEGEDAH